MGTRTLRFVLGTSLLIAIFLGCGEDDPAEPPAPKGKLAISIEGLPSGLTAAITVTGPNGFQQLITEAQTLTGLKPGGYDISVSTVSDGVLNFVAVPANFYRVVTAGETVSIAVTYAETVADNNFWIDGMYIVQTVQRYDGTVPLSADRAALLRVFVIATKSQVDAPKVRVSLYDSGDELINSYDIPAPAAGADSQIDEANLDSSWNVMIPADEMVPGMKIFAQLDPDNQIVEVDESDNRFPASGTPLPLDVRDLSVLEIRFVPVHQQSTGLTGDINDANKDDMLELAEKLFPMPGKTSDVRATYTTSLPELMPNDGNGSWGSLLSELWTLRNTEETTTRHWYGVVDYPYTAGIAGIAYVNGWTGMGRQLDSPFFGEIMPHELGHNLGRPHSACGVAGQDRDYPHPNGQIGAYGVDPSTGDVYPPSTPDVMGYCSGVWISDYTYEQTFEHRDQYDKAAHKASTPTTCLMVWGRIIGGAVVLEPAFVLEGVPRRPDGSGEHHLEVTATDGSTIHSVAFSGREVADLPRGPETHFSFLLPLTNGVEVEEIAVTSAAGGMARRVRDTEISLGKADIQLRRSAADRVDLAWNAELHPMLLVRDVQTGEILSLARNGRVEILTTAVDLEVFASNGIRSHRLRLAVQD